MRALISRATINVAANEYRNSLRNKWMIVASMILALFALSISMFSAGSAGRLGLSGFDITLVSLTSLVIYLVPLIALTLGYDTIVGEMEGKTMELMLTMPVSRGEIYLGKFLGLAAGLSTSIVVGFGTAGLLIASRVGGAALGPYLIFILTSVLLGLCFLSLAMFLSALLDQRAKAIGWATFLWFFFVLVFDLLLISVLVGTEGRIDPEIFPLMLYLNPTDVFRLIGVFSIPSVKVSYGLVTLAKGWAFQPVILFAGLLAWTVGPMIAGYLVFARKKF